MVYASIFQFPDGGGPDLIVDDGGDATFDGTYGCQGRADPSALSMKLPPRTRRELLAILKVAVAKGRDYIKDGGKYPA